MEGTLTEDEFRGNEGVFGSNDGVFSPDGEVRSASEFTWTTSQHERGLYSARLNNSRLPQHSACWLLLLPDDLQI